jgi:glucosamine-phosphate N-acetyltransferase
MNYIVRELSISDYEQYLPLINEFRQTHFTRDEFISILPTIQSYSTIYVIELDNELIATGTIIYEKKFIFNGCILAHIEDVCVKKQYRGNGFGKTIVNTLIQDAKKHKCYKITLDCSHENKDFYSKIGFETRGLQMSQLL